jgi:hypothetical protein
MVFAKEFERIKKALAREDANVESALVLIPLLILFLIEISKEAKFRKHFLKVRKTQKAGVKSIQL